MNVLVINAGSSSQVPVARHQDPRGLRQGQLRAHRHRRLIRWPRGAWRREAEARGGPARPQDGCEVRLPDPRPAPGFDTAKIEGIGHRVVQGGWYFPESKVVTDETLGWVREVAPLAPLHNYAEVTLSEICRDMFPSIGNVVSWPTPRSTTTSPRRPGATPCRVTSWTSCTSASTVLTAPLTATSGAPPTSSSTVTCTSWSPAILALVPRLPQSRTVTTWTPPHGPHAARPAIIMGTRCGTIDPATVCYLVREGGYTISTSSTPSAPTSSPVCSRSPASPLTLRDIEMRCREGRQELPDGASHVLMTTAPPSSSPRWRSPCTASDTMAFSAGIGENSAEMRLGVAKELEWLGVKVRREGKRGPLRRPACHLPPRRTPR